MNSKDIIFRVTPGQHDKFKVIVTRKRTSMQKVLVRLLSSYISDNSHLVVDVEDNNDKEI